jgi:hypothetical protein
MKILHIFIGIKTKSDRNILKPTVVDETVVLQIEPGSAPRAQLIRFREPLYLKVQTLSYYLFLLYNKSFLNFVKIILEFVCR